MQLKIAVVFVVLVLVATVPAAGHNEKVTLGDVQLAFVKVTKAPTLTCVGGKPTGGYPRCTTGTTRILTSNEVQRWQASSHTLPGSVDGFITFVVNCSFSPKERGQCWGTFKWGIPKVGYWEGHWTSAVMDMMTYESKMSLVGWGKGGAIATKHMVFDGGSAAGEYYIMGTIGIQ